MSYREISVVCSAALLVATSAAQLSAQARVVDLTDTTPNLPEWKIVASVAGGSIVGPVPPSHVPVTVLLTSCTVRNAEFFFSVEIKNNRKSEVQIPVSMNSKLFDRRGTITFRQLLIQLGTATNAQDPSTFKRDPALPSIILFGDQSVPGTFAALGPGENLILRLKSEIRSANQDVRGLRVQIGGSDATLSPKGGGYSKSETWVPALFAISEPACSGPKPEGE